MYFCGRSLRYSEHASIWMTMKRVSRWNHFHWLNVFNVHAENVIDIEWKRNTAVRTIAGLRTEGDGIGENSFALMTRRDTDLISSVRSTTTVICLPRQWAESCIKCRWPSMRNALWMRHSSIARKKWKKTRDQAYYPPWESSISASCKTSQTHVQKKSRIFHSTAKTCVLGKLKIQSALTWESVLGEQMPQQCVPKVWFDFGWT